MIIFSSQVSKSVGSIFPECFQKLSQDILIMLAKKYEAYFKTNA